MLLLEKKRKLIRKGDAMAIVAVVLEALILLGLVYIGGLLLFGIVVDQMNSRARRS